jgi:hypothetical protein
MQPSLPGLLVCGIVLSVAYGERGPLVGAIIVALIASLAFGSTAFMTLSALGGSTPLIFTAFSLLLIAAVAVRRNVLKEVGQLFARVPSAAVLTALMVYAVVGALLLPRLFAGQTSAFTKPPDSLLIIETSLAPVSGNITQTGYLVLNGATALALCILLLAAPRWTHIRRGFVLLAALTAGFGVLDLASKLAGAGDILAPIRTANYALLTESNEGNFARIVGAFPEASSFATLALACLAFTYTYWRRTGDRLMLGLWITLAGLLALSTSTTAYAGLTVLAIAAAAGLARSVATDRIHPRDILVVALFVGLLVLALALALYREGFFDPFIGMLDRMVLDKGASDSGRERSYWNEKSLQGFSDTYGLGIGVGSSRASSWPVAVVSQLGMIGSVFMALLTLVIFVGMRGASRALDPATETLVASVRASALASLGAASLIVGSPDPGPLFFVALAVVACARAMASRPASPVRLRPLTQSLPSPETRVI